MRKSLASTNRMSPPTTPRMHQTCHTFLRNLVLLLALVACLIAEVRSQPTAAPTPQVFSTNATNATVPVVNATANATIPTSSPSVSVTLVPTPSPTVGDEDGDGFAGDDDCDETDPNVNIGRLEICGDLIDNNCDGVVDESPCLVDADSDGVFSFFCSVNVTEEECDTFKGSFLGLVDCDDTDEFISPFGNETCGDGIDDDCDGVDEVCPPTQLPSMQPSTSFMPILQSEMPSQFPSSEPPAPSVLPTISLSETQEPTKVPPTRRPTRPTERPTRRPTAAAVNRTMAPAPTDAPSISQSPTAGLTMVTQTFRGLSITLKGIDTEMSQGAINVFTRTMEDTIIAYYSPSGNNTRRLLCVQESNEGNNATSRCLKAQNLVTEVEVLVVVVSQKIIVLDNSGDLQVVFDETITYFIPAESEDLITPDEVVFEPLQDAETSAQLSLSLQENHPEFATLDSVSTESSEDPVQSSGDADDDGWGLGIIIAIAAGGFVLLLAILLIVLKMQGNNNNNIQGKAERHDPLPVSINSNQRNDYYMGEEVSMVSDNHTYDDGKSAFGAGDQSVETIDYDYSKAYGGGEQSVVSSAGGTMGEYTRENASHAMQSNQRLTGRAALGASFDSEIGSGGQNNIPPGAGAAVVATRPPQSRDGDMVQEQTIEILAPPGKLGVVIDTPNSGPPVVHAVKDSSVIANLISVGDQLIKVDEVDVSDMTAIKVSKLISKRSANSQRKLTVIRKVVQ